MKEHPDIKGRLNQFRQCFQKAFAKDLSELELKLDNTMDLSRLAKIYGTKNRPGGESAGFTVTQEQRTRLCVNIC